MYTYEVKCALILNLVLKTRIWNDEIKCIMLRYKLITLLLSERKINNNNNNNNKTQQPEKAKKN